jgi:hypothetical protein
MGRPRFLDSRFKINIDSVARGEAPIEERSRLATGLADFVGFEGALDNIRDRSLFAASKPMSELACFGAANGELRLGHPNLGVSGKISQRAVGHQDGSADGLMAAY